jgi:hypothetical protein
MTKHGFLALIAAGTFALGASTTVAAGTAEHAAHRAGADAVTSGKVDATRMALRDLWVEHVFWIRSYVVASDARNAKAADAAAAEVVANAKQIAGAIVPFYGQAASDQLLTLLAGHWGAVKSFADATVAGKAKQRDAALTELTSNAKAIAKFLSGANPNLPYDALVGLLSAHGAHHVAQIDQLHAKAYGDEARTWAAMRGHMLTIADALAGGIAKQFPDKF